MSCAVQRIDCGVVHINEAGVPTCTKHVPNALSAATEVGCIVNTALWILKFGRLFPGSFKDFRKALVTFLSG